jgi:hypothetical protein
MTVSLCRQLTAIIMLIVVLLVSFNSIAHDYPSAATKDTCACKMQHGNLHGANVEHSEQHPETGTGDSCDLEECCSDDTEPPTHADALIRIPLELQFLLPHDKRITQVYLAIFVPPES